MRVTDPFDARATLPADQKDTVMFRLSDLTAPLRAAAKDAHGINLWAGTAFPACRAASAADILRDLDPATVLVRDPDPATSQGVRP